MNFPWKSSGTAFMALALGSAAYPLWAEETSVEISPRFHLEVSDGQSILEFGPLFNLMDDALRIKATVKAPMDGDPQGTSRIDKRVETLTGSAACFVRVFNPPPGPKGMRNAYLGLTMEAGYERFKYNPLPSLQQVEQPEVSYLVEAKGIYRKYAAGQGDPSWFPQVSVRYSERYVATPKADLVLPAPAGYPAMIRRRAISPPDYSETLTLAGAIPFYPGIGSMDFVPAAFFGIGLSDRFRLLRGEFWIRYFPEGEGIQNLRIGLSPFLSKGFPRNAPGGDLIPGVLFQVSYDAAETLFL